MSREIEELNDVSVEDDEITFLLRLKPSPTPPVRKRRSSLNCRTNGNIQSCNLSSGWDVIIEKQERSSPTPPPLPPRLQPSAPPEEIIERCSWSSRPYDAQVPYNLNEFYNKHYSAFSSSQPNLRYLDSSYNRDSNLISINSEFSAFTPVTQLPPRPFQHQVHYFHSEEKPNIVNSDFITHSYINSANNFNRSSISAFNKELNFAQRESVCEPYIMTLPNFEPNASNVQNSDIDLITSSEAIQQRFHNATKQPSSLLLSSSQKPPKPLPRNTLRKNVNTSLENRNKENQLLVRSQSETKLDLLVSNFFISFTTSYI